ncbi:alpha/beta hydrolase [Paenibacillus sambharensis]|uniref:Alpha/beta hydrolase n=2 Tax=Paenibacillus sambharensis TaxID=1803190 RepID=A0A2W1LC88_9BACL|nr:alpha/beta hydrolase [Paenibacillus sambharensis]
MGCSYTIKTAVPLHPASAEGYPVIYVLDGHQYFTITHDVVRLQSRNSAKTFISPSIVVGICLSGEDSSMSKQRFYDFTPAADQYKYPERLQNRELGKHGGAERFLEFLTQELQPEIVGRYPVNRSRQTLFGHSLGGLFTLYTLLAKPDSFQYYLAFSPSIWWNEQDIYRYMNNPGASVSRHSRIPGIFLTVGGEEGFMVDDARQFAERLRSSPLVPDRFDYYVAADENHASVVPAVMSRAIRFTVQS